MIAGSESLESRWKWWARMIASAIVVTGLHAGIVAYAYLQPPLEEVVEEAEGAFMIELAPMQVAAPSDASDTVGPPMEATQPQVVEKTPTEEVPEVTPPKEDPLPIAPDPELAMPIPKPVEEPKEEKEEEKPVEQKVVKEEEKKKEEEPETEKAKAQEAMVQQSAPSTPSPTAAPQTAARRQGTTDRKSSEEMSWAKALMNHLGRHRRYPSAARQAGQQGNVLVQFTLDRRGQVLTSRVVKSSSSRLLDQEALAMLTRAAPLPEPPSDLGGEAVELVIPIQFTIR